MIEIGYCMLREGFEQSFLLESYKQKFVVHTVHDFIMLVSSVFQLIH